MKKLFAAVMLVASTATVHAGDETVGQWSTWKSAQKTKHASLVYRVFGADRCPRSITPFEFSREYVKAMDQAARENPKASWPEASLEILRTFGCRI